MPHHAGREGSRSQSVPPCFTAGDNRFSRPSLRIPRAEGDTIMTMATLVKVVRDPRSGEVHLPSEQVAVLRVTRNLDRTLLKVRWQSGGHCVVFPDDIEEISQK